MKRKSMKPNLLFIMTDHQRSDSIGMKQDGISVTPNLNNLAKKASVFNRAYNTCPLCVPARTALATGKYPTENGVVFNDWQGERASQNKTMHQYFSEAGYVIGHIGIDHIKVNPPLKSQKIFAEWLDENNYMEYCVKEKISFTQNNLYKNKVIENQKGRTQTAYYSNTKTDIYPFDLENFRDIYFSRKSVDFIENTKEPFALFVNLWAPHPPLLVPEPYASKFCPTRIDLPENVGKAAKKQPPKRQKGVPSQLAKNISIEEWQRVWAAHLGLVNLADYGIGLMLEALKSRGCYNNTIIVFTSDHGDHLGQHKMYQKMEMYEQAVNVPLIICHPEGKPQEINSVVSHLDILPTLLEFIEIIPPKKFEGDSLAKAIRYNVPLEEKTVYSQYSGNPTIGDIRRSAITKRYKYIYTYGDLSELYDLENDPLEMNNLAGINKFSYIENELSSKCSDWHKRHGDFIY